MRILAIETSCDETSVAVVENGTHIMAHELATSAPDHVKTGGIVPEVGARQQIIAMIPTLEKAMHEHTPNDIDAIAVTVGPGLIGSLIVGVETAKALAAAWHKPLIPIDHVVAHLYAPWLEGNIPTFPALGLIISGGHSEFLLLHDHGDVEFLGGTRDDAIGEAFDKVARLVGLPYPGGPEIEKLAKDGNPDAIPLPRPMTDTVSLEMSFSGLKNAVRLAASDAALDKADIAASFQKAVTDVLLRKIEYALQTYAPTSLIVAGGVAANTYLREKIVKTFADSLDVYISPLSLSVDNAAMIACCAYFNNQPMPIEEVVADPNYHSRTVGTSRRKKV